MDNTIVVYGSSTGTCENIAQHIAEQLGADKSHVINVSKLTADMVPAFDNLILGTSTWGAGEYQEDWNDELKVLKKCDLGGKNVALFGCGDCESFSDTFCGGMAQLWDELKDKGAHLIGKVSTEGYTFDDSESVVDGQFIGLPLDEVNEEDKTDERISNWVEEIKKSLK